MNTLYNKPINTLYNKLTNTLYNKHINTLYNPNSFSRRHYSYKSSGDIVKKFDRLSPQQRLYLETIKKDYDEASSVRHIRHSQTSERFIGKFSPLYSAYRDYCNTLDSIVECHELMKEPEMEDIAWTDILYMDRKLELAYTDIESEISESLQPSGNNIFLEVRMAAGGVESSVFAKDLLKMYETIAVSRGFQWTVLEEDSRGEIGIANAIVSVSGPDVLGVYQFEAGVHRVQRVPLNDTRVHTSTSVVLVTNKPDHIDIKLDENDLDISYMRASGPGGQFVQRTNSKCRIVHKPTGTSVTNQTSRLAQDNKNECLKKLAAILLKKELEENVSSTERTKKSQAMQGDRSDKIRTYNYKSGVITDHRYKVEVSGISDYFTDPDCFMELHRRVSSMWQLQKLSDIAEEISKSQGQSSNSKSSSKKRN
ncbi:hypothetical protein ACHWQZ_G013002 [Mnemiopsis leidyi]